MCVMGAAIFFAGQVWRPQKMAGRGGGGGPRRGEDGGGGAAPPARPQWRSFLGRGGEGRGVLGQQSARGPLSAEPGRPAARPSPREARGRGRALAGLRGLDLAPGPGRRLSPAFLWGASLPRLRPRPFPEPQLLPGGAFRGGGGARPALLSPAPRAGRILPAAALPALASPRLGGAGLGRHVELACVRARRRRGLSPRCGEGLASAPPAAPSERGRGFLQIALSPGRLGEFSFLS